MKSVPIEVVTSGLAHKNLSAIAAAEWPRLERLAVWFGDGEYGGGDCSTTESSDSSELMIVTLRRLPILPSTAVPNTIWVWSRTCFPSSRIRISTSDKVMPGPPATLLFSEARERSEA